ARTLRCPHRGAALQPRRRRTGARLAGRTFRRSGDRAGYPFGRIRALATRRPDRGGRGTRHLLQAAGRFSLSRARLRADARAIAGPADRLGSATPSLETLANVEAGRYTRVRLHHRARARPPSPVHVLDLRGLKLANGLS